MCVDDGEFAFFGAREDVVGFLEADSFACGDQVGGHDFGYGRVGVVVELDVAGGDDADEFAAEGAVFWRELDIHILTLRKHVSAENEQNQTKTPPQRHRHIGRVACG